MEATVGEVKEEEPETPVEPIIVRSRLSQMRDDDPLPAPKVEVADTGSLEVSSPAPTSPANPSDLGSLCTLMQGKEQMFAQTVLAHLASQSGDYSQTESQLFASFLVLL